MRKFQVTPPPTLPPSELELVLNGQRRPFNLNTPHASPYIMIVVLGVRPGHLRCCVANLHTSHFGLQIIGPAGAATSSSPPIPEPPRLLPVFDDVFSSSPCPHAHRSAPRLLPPNKFPGSFFHFRYRPLNQIINANIRSSFSPLFPASPISLIEPVDRLPLAGMLQHSTKLRHSRATIVPYR
jgi:hypothetical protein